MKAPRKIEIFETREALTTRAADLIVEKLDAALSEKPLASLVLSGGSTPKDLYTLLVLEKYKDKIPWEKLLIFFGDERCVPPDHPDSNYKMAHDALLSQVSIPSENIFRMKGELSPDIAAAEYETAIKSALGEHPKFDIVLLGMGADGHTASLFPGTTALAASEKLVAANYVEKLDSWRLTLTPPAINMSRNIFFLIAGNDKAKAVKEILENDADSPAQLIAPRSGSLFWLLDDDAASQLSSNEKGYRSR